MDRTIYHNNAPVGAAWRNSNGAQMHAKEGLDDGELANVHGVETTVIKMSGFPA